MAPKDENELRRMLLTAIEHDGPIALRYPRGTAAGIHLDKEILPLAIGKAEIIHAGEADDVLVIAIGQSVSEAVKAHEELVGQGIGTTVVNARFVKPLDIELILRLAERIPRIVTVEDNTREGGFGSAVLEALVEAGLNPLHVVRLGIDDEFVSHGPQRLLRHLHHIDADAIVAAVKALHPQSHLQATAGKI